MISFGEFLLRKILETLLALFALVLLSFLFLHLLPGGPFDEHVSWSPAVQESLRHLWALDQPLLSQFTQYLERIATGNLGMSMVHAETSVSSILGQGYAQTIQLNALAILLSFGMAFVTSSFATLFRGGLFGYGLQGLSIVGISLPSLFLGPVLIYVFGFYWNLLPTAFLSSPAHYILPVMTLSLRPWAQLNLLLTNSLDEAMSMEFVRTAKAKGLSKFNVVIKHALKNSVLPILSLSGPMIAGLISGSFLVELLFSIHGLGQQFTDSLNERDYPVILGLVLVYGVTLIVLTNLFEAIAVWIDPRTREQA